MQETYPVSAVPTWFRDAPASVFAYETGELTLNADAIGRQNSGLVGRIAGFQRDLAVLALETLQRCLFIIDEGDDDVAGIG